MRRILGFFVFFFGEETIVDFIYTKLCYTMEKRKDGHSSNQTMISLFSFATLTKARATGLYRK